MKKNRQRFKCFWGLIFLLLLSAYFTALPYPVSAGMPVGKPFHMSFKTTSHLDKWSLWINGPHLRGANITQRRVYEVDGPTFFGPGPLGPPVTQQDINDLSNMGANYVNLSYSGLFTIDPPYQVDLDVQDALDKMLDMIANADMFAVITFRSGPGRSEFALFYWDGLDDQYINDSVWTDPTAQDAWVDMWRYTANRYKNHPIVAGYDLMCEPNTNDFTNASGKRIEIWDPTEFYDQYGGTTYDWRQLYPRIVAAIREADSQTPVLISGNGYSRVDFLPYRTVIQDSRVVYTVHQYEPHLYINKWPDDPLFEKYSYPGICDVDWDGQDDNFNRTWMENLLKPIDTFQNTHSAPMAVNEYGVFRWANGGHAFMDDQMDTFEQYGVNYALWEWSPSWEPIVSIDDFNFRHGPNPENHTDVETSQLIEVIKKYWAKNVLRPSSFSQPVTPMPSPTPVTPTSTSTATLTFTPTATPTPTIPLEASDYYVLYDDAPNQLEDWSWETTVEFASDDQVQSGSYAMAVTYTSEWGKLYLHLDTVLSKEDFTDLHFWIFGGTGAEQSIVVGLVDGNQQEMESEKLKFFIPSRQPDKWTEVNIPLSAFGEFDGISGFTWQDRTGQVQPTIYLDQIILIRKQEIEPEPTATNTSTPIRTHTLSNTPTQTPAFTPTPRPPRAIVLYPNSIQVYDNSSSTQDLSGSTDFDTANNLQLVVEWEVDDPEVTDWHVYAQVDIYGYFYVGRTGSGAVQRFEWPGSTLIDSDQAHGPALGHTYRFQTIGLRGGNGLSIARQSAPVGFALKGFGEAPIFTVKNASVPERILLVTDDIFDTENLIGGTDTDPTNERALFIRWNVGNNTYWNYHVFVSVNASEYAFLGQTGSDKINYYRWSSIPLFTVDPAFKDGPQNGNHYQFRIFGLKSQGADFLDADEIVEYQAKD